MREFNSDSYPYANGGSDGNRNSYSNLNGDARYYANPDSYPCFDAYAKSCPRAYVDADSEADAHANAYSSSDMDSSSDVDANAASCAYPHANASSHAHPYTNAYSYDALCTSHRTFR